VGTVYFHVLHDFHANVNSSSRVFWRRNTDTPRGNTGWFIGSKSQHFDTGLLPRLNLPFRLHASGLNESLGTAQMFA
jgi:hypothetical protein